MQFPQLYRRGVVRPLDEYAAKQLAAFKIDASIRVEWLTVLGDEHFGEIWQTGILQRINQACGIGISDYEEVELKACDVPKALKVLGNIGAGSREVATFFEALKALLEDARTTSHSVYFIF